MITASPNLADISQFRVGSNTLKFTPFFIKALNIPGISMQHTKLSTRSGVKLGMGADNMEFEALELEVMLDSNFDTYFELMELISEEIDWDYDTFSQPTFDLWIQVLNQKKDELFRFEFENCRISSVSSLALTPEAELGANVTVNIDYDFYRWFRRNKCNNIETVKRFNQPAPNPNPQQYSSPYKPLK